MSGKRLFVMTGDASGDVHGSHVIRQLQALDPTLDIQAVGGVCIAETGVNIFYPQERLGALGLPAILRAIPSHMGLGFRLLEHFKTWRPDAVLLIDYGMFNLWLAAQLKRAGVRVCYYIPPQVWASRRGRLHKIRRFVDHVFCIFPFEKPLYDAHGIAATYVGHPLVEELPPAPERQAFCAQHGLDPEAPIVGLFPGSRRAEIRGLLPLMLQALPQLQEKAQAPLQFVVALSPAISPTFFEACLAPHRHLLESVQFHVLSGVNYEILALSYAAMVSSGTVTLEAALYNTPAVITYPINPLLLACLRPFSYVRHIGLPNILAGDKETLLPELFGRSLSVTTLVETMQPFLVDSPQRTQALACYAGIQTQLHSEGSPSQAVAKGLMTQLGLGALVRT